MERFLRQFSCALDNMKSLQELLKDLAFDPTKNTNKDFCNILFKRLIENERNSEAEIVKNNNLISVKGIVFVPETDQWEGGVVSEN